jgi:hypothetical protein
VRERVVCSWWSSIRKKVLKLKILFSKRLNFRFTKPQSRTLCLLTVYPYPLIVVISSVFNRLSHYSSQSKVSCRLLEHAVQASPLLNHGDQRSCLFGWFWGHVAQTMLHGVSLIYQCRRLRPLLLLLLQPAHIHVPFMIWPTNRSSNLWSVS